VQVLPQDPEEFLNERYIRHVMKEKRGVAVFVPTRAEVEKLAVGLGEQWPRLNTAFYHGGEPIRVIRPFLEGEVERPFLLAMTAAGQSALNVRGLDTVIIYDARYGNVVDRGRNVLHRLYLGANEILQMAGRVHGRVPNGEVVILSDRELKFESLRPGPPEFQLGGDAERVAITSAALGVDARDLELPVPLDRTAYSRAIAMLTSRGLVENGKLSRYGKEVEALPVDRPWGELLVHADKELIPMVAVSSSIDSLHRMTREERDLHGLVVNGSDHLTAYNLYAEAVNQHGYLGEVYGLPRHLFEEGLPEWAERRGVLVKAIEDTALGMASVYRSLDVPLPKELPYASKEIRRQWADLIARIMPFDLVLDEHTADGQEARVSRTSVAGSWGAVAGSLRYFADRFGVPRASIEGTTLSYDLVRQYATLGPPTVVLGGPRKHQRLMVERRRSYFGFPLETEVESIEGEIPAGLRDPAREVLALALVSGETTHSDQNRLRRTLADLDELWRRSGGTLTELAPDALQARIRGLLDGVTSWDDFLRTRIVVDPADLVDAATRERLQALPGRLHLRGDAVPLDYEVIGGEGVARVRLREGQAKRLRADEIPPLDRPLRFAVQRGRHPPLLADTIPALQALLRRAPKSNEERPGPHGDGRGRRGHRQDPRPGRGGRPRGRTRH
jgi:ATP-dependent helicase HrpA